MNRQETKKYLLKRINSLLNETEDEDYESTDIAEDALCLLDKIKEYLEKED